MIVRVGAGRVSEAEARKLAPELITIVEAYRALRAVQPECKRNKYPALQHIADIEEADVVFSIIRTALGMQLQGGNPDEGPWLYGQFSSVDGEELYDRFIQLCDQIDGTDLAAA
jgi:hypothetical protein